MSDIQLIQGDAIAKLKEVEDESCDYGCLSNTYYYMCDYAIEGQHGLEPTIQKYLDVQKLVFDEMYRVLKPYTLMSVIIGDTSNNYSTIRKKGDRRKPGAWDYRRPIQEGYRESEDLEIPRRLQECLTQDEDLDAELAELMLEMALLEARRKEQVIGGVSTTLKRSGWCVLPSLIWDKGYSGRTNMMGGISHEWILMFMKQPKGRRLKPAYLKKFTRTILHYKAVSDPVHPCPMPLGLAAELIDHCCIPGGKVIDPYVGTGTTLIAAHRSGRNGIGIDLDITRAKARLQEEYDQISLFDNATLSIAK